MIYPLAVDLASEGLPVTVTCRVLGFSTLGFSTLGFYAWRAAIASWHHTERRYRGGLDVKARATRARRSSTVNSPQVLTADDRRDIRDLADSYAVNTDRRNADSNAINTERRDGISVAELFAPGARMLVFADGDLTAEPSIVRREEMATRSEWSKQFILTRHFVGQQLIEAVDADHASGVVYCIANHVYDDADGNRMNLVVNLRYFDRYEKHEGTWLFAERRLVFDFIDTRPAGGHFPGVGQLSG